MRDSVLDGEIGIIALQKGRFGKPKQAFWRVEKAYFKRRYTTYCLAVSCV